MSAIAPWANGPFELLVHAEQHLRLGDDFDRRMALISFDNAIEVAITTYLTLHPLQRGNRTYKNEDVENWLRNYHTKLDFVEIELSTRALAWDVPKSHVIWAHDHRNEQYHGGQKGTPEKNVLATIRKAALWMFRILYDVPDVERLLGDAIAALTLSTPTRNAAYDRVLDDVFGLVPVAGQKYYTSELLFAVDAVVYEATARDLQNNEQDDDLSSPPSEGSDKL